MLRDTCGRHVSTVEMLMENDVSIQEISTLETFSVSHVIIWLWAK